MGNLYKHAERELNIILNNIDKEKDTDGYEMQKLMTGEILELVKLFESQGDSGCSASYKISKLVRLLKFKTISPLTGCDSEWGEPYGDDNLQQNKRCSSVFRNNFDNATAYDIDKYSLSDNGGISWWSVGKSKKEKLGLSDKITFPYSPTEPKLIYIKYKDIKKHDDFDDITRDENAIKELRDDYNKHPDDWRW